MKMFLSTATKLLSVIPFITAALFFSGCKKDSDPINNNINTSAYSGIWAISTYWDDVDETSDFSGYTFAFGSNNVLTAIRNGVTVTGTWNLTTTKLIIDFGTDPVLQELNDDWLINEKTATTIRLKEDNPAQDDRLEFIKR